VGGATPLPGVHEPQAPWMSDAPGQVREMPIIQAWVTPGLRVPTVTHFPSWYLKMIPPSSAGLVKGHDVCENTLGESSHTVGVHHPRP
jgi:hypothetical protein